MTTAHPPISLPINVVRRALADYEKSVDDVYADELTEEEKHLADTVRLLIAHVDATDPVAVAQHTLDAHAIKPDWRRSGEQILSLLVEAIGGVLGKPGASQTDATPALRSFAEDRELLNAVLAVLPMESAESPMPFVEVVRRVTQKSGYNSHEVRGALVALESKNEARLQHGLGWSRTERD